jgi:hypothetical protein
VTGSTTAYVRHGCRIVSRGSDGQSLVGLPETRWRSRAHRHRALPRFSDGCRSFPLHRYHPPQPAANPAYASRADARAHRCTRVLLRHPYTYGLPSDDSAHILSYQELPTSIQCGEARARRRQEERQAGIVSRGMVRRWGRCSSRVRHRVVPARARVPERCHASGAAVDVCSDAPAEAQRAERTAEGGLETFHEPSLGRHVHRE